MYTTTMNDVPMHENPHTHNLQTCIIYTNKILTPGLSTDLEIFKAKKCDSYTARYKNIALHSMYDPAQEAEITCKDLEHRSFDSIILLGAGLGHTLTLLLEQYKGIPVLCVEYDAKLFATLLHYWHYPDTGSQSKHTFFIQARPADITEHLRERGLRSPYILQTPLAKRFFPSEEVVALRAEVAEYQMRAQVNDNTLGQFSRLWQVNTIRICATHAPSLCSLSLLENTCSNLPALLCCAGPTLYQYLPYIQALAPYMLVVAVDTAVGVLTHCGIVPDFICSVDPQYINTQHLHWQTQHACHYLIDLAVSPRLFELTGQLAGQLTRQESTFFVSKPIIPLAQVLCHNLGVDADIHSGGSVATFAWDALRYMGVRDIYTVGLDLSYPLHAAHSRGCTFENAAHHISSRTEPAETVLHRAFCASPLFATPSYNNTPVLSDARLMVYHRWFAIMHKKFPNTKTYTFCKDGARIPSIRYREMHSVIEEMGSAEISAKQALRAYLEQQSTARKNAKDKVMQTVKKNAQQLHEKLAIFCTQCQKAAKLAYKGMQRKLSYAELQNLQEIECILLQEEHINNNETSICAIVGFFVQKDIQGIMTYDSASTSSTTYAKAYSLYMAMHNCTQDLLVLLQQNFKQEHV